MKGLVLIGIVTAICYFAIVTLSATPPRVTKPPRRLPNILIIVTDDQRQGLEVMPETVRRFIKQGQVFPQASVTTPLCCPSRSSILTGRFAHNHGVLTNLGMAHELDQTSTLEYYLKRQGYVTAIFGKFLNGWGLEKPPYFDEWAIAKSRTYFDGRYLVNGSMKTVPTYSTSYLRQKAVRFIHRNGSGTRQPWFMYLAPFAPHNPFVPQRKYANAPVPRFHRNPAMGESDRHDKPLFIRKRSSTDGIGAYKHEAQYRTLMSVDDMVKAVFAALHATQQGRDTLAFFLSDNGLFWGEHHLLGKQAPYLQSIEVPMMMRWPQAGYHGTADRRLVANVDIAPTVLDATNYQGPLHAPMDGRSLLDASWNRNRMLNEYWSNGEKTPTWAALTNKHFQYTEYYDPEGKIIFREYYDLTTDRWQLNNLLRDTDPTNDPDVRTLHDQLSEDRTCMGTTGPSACP